MKSVELSVVIPFYNEISLIERAVNSVLIQGLNELNIEIIIANDGFFENDTIKKTLNNFHFKEIIVVNTKGNNGPGAARNLAIQYAKGYLIAFLDADDFWLPGKINSQLQLVKSGANFVTTGYHFESFGTQVIPPSLIDSPIDVFLKRGIGTSTVLITRDLLQNNRFKNIRYCQDIDFWFALASQKNFIYRCVPKNLVCYSTGGSTKNKFRQLIYFNRVLLLNKVGLFNYFLVISSYIFHGINNHFLKKYLDKFLGHRCKKI